MAAREQYVDPYAHDGPWTEQDFLALPADRYVELIEGSLLVSPSGSNRHSKLCSRLYVSFDDAAPSGWEILESPNVRVGPNRILIPDLAVLRDADMDATVNDATTVRFVVEVVSPGNAFMDRAVKPQLYAEAGIPGYLRIERHPEAPVGHVHRLDGDDYREVSRGSVVTLETPFPVTLDLAHLARR